MLINELSKKTGVSVHAIRYYENLGLIKGNINEKVKSNNYKNYDESHIEKIEIIKNGQKVGFTLAEIKEIMNKWFSGTSTKEEILNFFDAKIIEIDKKIKQHIEIKKLLEEVKKNIEKGECV